MEGRSEERQALGDLLVKTSVTDFFTRTLALYHLTMRIQLSGVLHKIQRQQLKIAKDKRTENKADQEHHTKELWMELWPFFAAKMNQKHMLENLLSVASQMKVEYNRRIFQWTYNAYAAQATGSMSASVKPLEEVLLILTAHVGDDTAGMWDE